MTEVKRPQKGRIFISYRRVDSAGYAGRIYDRLVADFGGDAIFMDVDTIEGGVDFIKVLEDAVQSCDVLIALIGRQWLNIKDKDGKRRLDSPEDFVRIEIATALKRNIRVIPVLVDGVDMPQPTELPGDLKALARRNALQVNHHSFNPDVYRLIEHSKSALVEAEELRVIKAQALQAAHEMAEKEAAEEAARDKAKKDAEEKDHLGTENQIKQKTEHTTTEKPPKRLNLKNLIVLIVIVGLAFAFVIYMPQLFTQIVNPPGPTSTFTSNITQALFPSETLLTAETPRRSPSKSAFATDPSSNLSIYDDFSESDINRTIWGYVSNDSSASYSIQNGVLIISSGVVPGSGGSLVSNKSIPIESRVVSFQSRIIVEGNGTAWWGVGEQEPEMLFRYVGKEGSPILEYVTFDDSSTLKPSVPWINPLKWQLYVLVLNGETANYVIDNYSTQTKELDGTEKNLRVWG